METIELNHSSSIKNNNMNSSNNSTTSTTSIKIEEYQSNMVIHEEIEELPQEDEFFDKLQDEIDIIEVKLKKELKPQEKENLLFQQVKYKCQVGAFCGEKTSYKSCTKVRKDMENAMGEFSSKYCFIVFTGIESNNNIFIIPTLINQQKYFKVSYSTYNFICYEVSKESNIICNSLKLSSNTSIDESNNTSLNSSIVLQAISNVNQKQSNNITIAKNYMSSSNPKQNVQNSMMMSSSLGNSNSARKNSLNFQKKDNNNNNNNKRSSTLYLQQQIINDENRLKKQLQKQEKYKSSLVHNENEIPSREEMLKIAKSYTKFIGKENLRKPFTCKEYATAIQKAFQNKGIYPKMVIVKREPQGDFFWDYSCENEVTLHTWDMFKNQERGVAVVV